jgi:hypothetical protein
MVVHVADAFEQLGASGNELGRRLFVVEPPDRERDVDVVHDRRPAEQRRPAQSDRDASSDRVLTRDRRRHVDERPLAPRERQPEPLVGALRAEPAADGLEPLDDAGTVGRPRVRDDVR